MAAMVHAFEIPAFPCTCFATTGYQTFACSYTPRIVVAIPKSCVSSDPPQQLGGLSPATCFIHISTYTHNTHHHLNFLYQSSLPPHVPTDQRTARYTANAVVSFLNLGVLLILCPLHAFFTATLSLLTSPLVTLFIIPSSQILCIYGFNGFLWGYLEDSICGRVGDSHVCV